MPRRLRVEICGYHHVYNRGVARGDIFLDDKDKEKFLKILGNVSKEYRFNIHSFCLMDNHYHFLIENKRENLSDGMRQINSQYAIYFNKRYKRVGHLWQGRYKSWFVLDENYLFTLFKYIESNPIKAKITKKVGEYKYCATYSMLHEGIPKFLENSFVLRDYHTKELFELLSMELNDKEKENINKFHKNRYKINNKEVSYENKKELTKYFLDIKDRYKRNEAIKLAHDDGYKYSQIARQIGLSCAGVSKIIKKFKV